MALPLLSTASYRLVERVALVIGVVSAAVLFMISPADALAAQLCAIGAIALAVFYAIRFEGAARARAARPVAIALWALSMAFVTYAGFPLPYASVAVQYLSAGIVLLALSTAILLFTSPARNKEPQTASREVGWFLALAAVVGIGLALRLWNLAILDPYTDEYNHLLAAKEYLATGAFAYTRAKLVTWLVILMYQVGHPSSFADYVFWGRLPGAVISALTAIPLYLVARRISRPVALTAALLWATSPWAVGVGRAVREYAFYPFVMLCAVLLLMSLVDALLKKRLRPAILSALPLAALTAYAFVLDPLSTLKVSVLALIAAGFALLCIRRADIRRAFTISRRTLYLLGGAFAAAVAAGCAYVALNESSIAIGFQASWLSLFFNTPGSPMHWWTGLPLAPYAAIFLVVSGIAWACAARRREAALPAIVFAGLLFFYACLFGRYFRPRYAFYAFPFFTILLASGVIAQYAVIRHWKTVGRLASGALVIAFLVSFTSLTNVAYPATSAAHGYVKQTDEYHDYVRGIIDLVAAEKRDGDAFVTTIPARGALELGLGIPSSQVFSYPYDLEARFAETEAVVSSHPGGFIILDWRRNGYWSKGYPKEGEFLIGTTIVRTLRNENGFQIYRWGVSPITER